MLETKLPALLIADLHFHPLMLDASNERYREPDMRFPDATPSEGGEVGASSSASPPGHASHGAPRPWRRRRPLRCRPLAVAQPHLAVLAADSVRGIGRRWQESRPSGAAAHWSLYLSGSPAPGVCGGRPGVSDCGGQMLILAAIHPPDATRAILECLWVCQRAPRQLPRLH